jgi:hypothetical protein
MWAHSLRQKLTGMPSYEVLKGDKDSAFLHPPCVLCAIITPNHNPNRLLWTSPTAVKIKRRWYRTQWGRLVVFYGGLFALLFFVWFFLFATSSMCITDHPVEFSTRFTRSFSSPMCGTPRRCLSRVAAC